MKIKTAKLSILALVGLCLPLSLQAGKFHFPVGLTYSQGIYNTADTLFDLYEDAGYDLDDRIIIPVGLSLSPYYEWDMGLGVGVTVGPTAFFVVDEKFYGDYYTDDTKFSYIIPVGADLRYTLFNDRNVSPYVKVGFRYPIAGGDNLSSSSSEIGVYGAVGVELWRTKTVGMGLEVGYDTSKVTLKGPTGVEKEETFGDLMVTLSVVF